MSRTFRASAWGALLLAAPIAPIASVACGVPARPAHAVDQSTSAPAPAQWATSLDRDHPLVGRLWDSRRRTFVTEGGLIDALARASFVALGEQHDNPDHHRLQARLIHALVERGRAPTVVLEMLDVERQPDVDRARREHPQDPDAIGLAVDWGHSGWPAWALYRPVFAVAVDAGLPIVAAGVNREGAMRLAEGGVAALDPVLVQRFALGAELDAPTASAMRAEMRDAHCGLLPEEMLDSMVLVQRARDATLADRLLATGAGRAGGSVAGVLIAGNGHVRRDRGVPAALGRAGATDVLAVGIVEVRAALREPAAYAAELGAAALPFDFVWFTPRASDADHCAELRSRRRAPARRAAAGLVRMPI